MLLRTDNTGTNLGQVGFTPGQDYLIVGKIETAAGAGANDTISISIWQNGTSIGSEPVSWGATGLVDASDTDAEINRLYLTGSGNVDQFDEIVFGNSFQDVTGVPEPSTYALIAGILTLGIIALRRRR